MRKPLPYAIVSVLLVAWLSLTLSGWGLLYLSEPNNELGRLTCHYFMGTRTFVWTRSFTGNGTCPTWQNPMGDRKPR